MLWVILWPMSITNNTFYLLFWFVFSHIHLLMVPAAGQVLSVYGNNWPIASMAREKYIYIVHACCICCYGAHFCAY